MLDPAVGYLLVVGVAALLGCAAFHKLSSPREFAQALGAYRLLPVQAVRPASRALPGLELATGVGLLIPASRGLSCIAAALIMLIYAGAIAINLIRGRRDLDCGCGLARDRRPIAGWMLVRNVAIATAALVAASPWSSRSLVPIDLLTILAGTAAAALLYASIDVLLGRVAPRGAMARVR
jgi:hypothetical protein